MSNKHLLVILDGYGLAEDPSVSAIHKAETPFMDRMLSGYPNGTLVASGLDVGLPAGQMGNSEVGHMNLGAGRVVYQEITRIDRSIEDGSFYQNTELVNAIDKARIEGRKLHIMGLFSDGGVHSHNGHLVALLELASRRSVEDVYIHAFTDGRDTSPHGAIDYARELNEAIERIGIGSIASVVGRYFAMDRDNRWQRTLKAYKLLTTGSSLTSPDAVDALQSSYDYGVTDEFVEPVGIGDPDRVSTTRIGKNDVVIFYNFRADRARQLTRAFIQADFDAFDRAEFLDPHFVTFTPYDKDFELPIAFPRVNLVETLGEIVAQRGGRQLRAAETEKYPHVTYFFSGGREDPFEGEDRILVPSPRVATYDLQPEMSAPELADRVAMAVGEKDYNLVILNFANPDMVGHTGVFEAAVRAVETVDRCAEKVVEAALAHGYSIQIIADHGNADKMLNPDGSAHTAHTTALVPHVVIADGFDGPVKPGKLGDIAPTILKLLDQPIPDSMTGDVLV